MNKIMIGITLLFTGSAACGMSPQFNHRYPNRELNNTELSQATECAFFLKSENLCASMVWIKEPNRDDEGSFKLRFWKNAPNSSSTGPWVDPAYGNVFIKLWMPDMGHGSQKVTLQKQQDANGNFIPGDYLATQVYFVMGGKWEIILQIKDANGAVIDQAKIIYHAL